jgi:molecular chaperone GrpE
MDKKDQNQDDIVYEKGAEKPEKTDEEIVPEESDAPELLIKKLKEKLKVCEKEKQDYMNGWQRERADFVNFKKTCEKEKFETIKFANENLISELLPVLDSFEMAFANKEAWEKADKNWRIGVEYIHSQLLKILKENGLEELNPLNDKFSPMNHVADEMRDVKEESQNGVIVEVKKKGWSLNGRIVVAPKVVVGEFKK